ncbi:prohibitin family protein, partial [bacterium]|nr:prohibitin family protein [bacterium]
MLFVFSIILIVIALVVWRNASAHKHENPVSFNIARISPVAVVVFGFLALLQCFTQIPAGHVGVIDFFGIVSDRILPS